MTRMFEGQALYDPAPGEQLFALIITDDDAPMMCFYATMRADFADRYVAAGKRVELHDLRALFVTSVADIRAHDADESADGLGAWINQVAQPPT